MARTVKTAISLPTEVFEDAEKLSKELGRSRSAFYVDAIKHYLSRAERLRMEHHEAQVYRKHPNPDDWDPHEWDEIYKQWLKDHPEPRPRRRKR